MQQSFLYEKFCHCCLFRCHCQARLKVYFLIAYHTLQKHIQNILRKTNVSSKWELLRLQ